MAADVDLVLDEDTDIEQSRTELDSHANMPVVGRHAHIISDTGRIAEVNAFTPDYEPMQLPIVDAAIQYDCPYDGQSYILIIRNALHVPAMKNNLLPPFVMREAGIQVFDTPKIQMTDPTIEDHSICFPETGFRIPLTLWGMFSYFPTSKPTTLLLQETKDIYLLTASRWNPHDDSYATNEENMLDWEGNMTEKKDRVQILLSDIADDSATAASVQISSIENCAIDSVLQRRHKTSEEKIQPLWQPIPRAIDEVSSVLAGVSPILNDEMLYQRMQDRADLGRFQMSIGSTDSTPGRYLVTDVDSDSDDDDDSSISDGAALDDLYNEATQGHIDLDEVMLGATHAGKKKGIDAADLSKMWRIDLETAERTLDVTSQNSKRVDDPTLSWSYGTNDRMLRYKQISEYFFMDTFFATKKATKSTRSNTCCQLFVTDKGFVYVVPMKSKAHVIDAVKQFAKEIGAPDALIFDMSGEQTSRSLRQFCLEIGTSLRVLEEGTPWANKAELYIGLIKEDVCKDMIHFRIARSFSGTTVLNNERASTI
jgi:hypothetical protein